VDSTTVKLSGSLRLQTRGTTLIRVAFAPCNPRRVNVANIIAASAGSLMNGEPNLSTTERGIYMIAGLGLAAAAAKPRPNPLLNVLALAGGSYLAWRGYVSNCPVKAALMGSDHDG
jgi:hypothetical protein